MAPDGVTVITELSDGTKRIKVKTLDRRTDIQALADEIVTTCKLIHHSKTGKVRSLLAELRDRTANASSGAKTRKDALEVVHDEARVVPGAFAKRRRRVSETREHTRPRRACPSRSRGRSRRENAGRDRRARGPSAARRGEADFLGAAHGVVATTSAPLVSEIGSSGLVSRLAVDVGRLGVGESGKTKSMHEHMEHISGAFVRRRSRDARRRRRRRRAVRGGGEKPRDARRARDAAADARARTARGRPPVRGHRHECPSGVLRALQRVGVPRPNPR